MNNFLIFLLGLFLIFCIIGINLNKKFDVFSLYNFFLLIAIAEIPYLVFISHNQDSLHPFADLHIKDFDYVFQLHILFKMLFLLVCLLTMHFYRAKASFLSYAFNVNGRKQSAYMFMALLMFLLTIVIYILFLNKVGGFHYLIANFSNKTLVVQGTGWYRNAFLVTAMLSTGFMIFALKDAGAKKIIFIPMLGGLLLIFFIMLASIGERKNPLILLLFSIIMWHYTIKKINIFRIKYFVLGGTLVIFAATAPVLREDGASEYYLANPSLLYDAITPHMGELFKRFSEVDISLFIYSYFSSPDDYWYWASFPDLVRGIIPSTYYPDKPPLDEGVYIYALAHLYNVTPPTPFNEMIPVGWPLSRVTSGYVHFGPWGIVLYAILTGLILKYVYASLLRTGSPQAIALYAIMMISSFGISNAFIANTAVVLFLLIFLGLPLRFFSRRRSIVYS